ncbi:MAG: septum site-determining protein MinC [Rhodanobacter sp.]|jgi:septum site-determining protein MinC|nr:septum site-determining protein MinC [Rhodanobacter sp.]
MATATLTIPEPVVEIKFGQVGIAQLKLKRLDPDGLTAELAEKMATAENLFLRTPLVLDLSHLSTLPDIDTVRDLLARIRSAGMMPVGLSYGTSENDALARALDVPIFAKFRVAPERAPIERAPAAPSPPPRAAPRPPAREPASTPAPAPAPASTPVPASGTGIGMMHNKPVRSGQQIYARGRDLTLTALISHGAEVIADGSIHIYGALRGRALAGAQGDETARIFCREFHAELISIAGQYRVFEDIPAELRGHSIQAWLEGGRLMIARLDAGKS